MLTRELTCLFRCGFEPNTLLAAHPPQLRNDRKRAVYDLACPPGARHGGEIELSRWAAAATPATLVLAPSELIVRPGYYDYAGQDNGVWHVNFADPALFFAYGGPLLAQDELQAAEHPALGSLREALVAAGEPAVTADDSGPTPVLVRGVERRCAIATAPDAAAGRPAGLYGNWFAASPIDVVRGAVHVFEPPVLSNLIAIAAPAGGRGAYDADEIVTIAITAYTGFAAAVDESHRAWPGTPVEIRTGFWGCGAFGGNRELMTVLQLLAARLAGVDRLMFYASDDDGIASYRAGEARLAELLRDTTPSTPVSTLLERVHAVGYAWGYSNGT